MAENPNLRHKLGISRRDLLRRGAVVGGTLLWTVPVVSTLSRADIKKTKSPAYVCCECRVPTKRKLPPVKCQPKTVDTASQCQATCKAAGYKIGSFHISPTFIACSDSGTDPSGCATH